MNKLIVTGAAEDLKKFSEAVKGKVIDDQKGQPDVFSLQNILPMPAEFSEGDKWYDWCLENWGTKWDCCGASVEDDDTSLRYYFQTAWSPFSYKLFEKMCSMYPALEFRLLYTDHSMVFLGAYNQTIPYKQYEEGDLTKKTKSQKPTKTPTIHCVPSSKNGKSFGKQWVKHITIYATAPET